MVVEEGKHKMENQNITKYNLIAERLKKEIRKGVFVMITNTLNRLEFFV